VTCIAAVVAVFAVTAPVGVALNVNALATVLSERFLTVAMCDCDKRPFAVFPLIDDAESHFVYSEAE
jgi:hypothetical protein